MIVVESDGEFRFTTQNDHARHAEQVLSLFRLPELIEHPRRERLLRAVGEHDNGWREADAAPLADPATGRPLGFRQVPAELRREIWTRGCRRWSGDDAYVALLITLHGIALHRDRAGDPDWDAWLQEHEALALELRHEAGLTAEEAEVDYSWLQMADSCSLAACEGRPTTFTSRHFRVQFADRTLHMTPFPLAGTTTFQIPQRRLATRRFDGDRDLGAALARARWERRAVPIAPDKEPAVAP